MKISEVRNILPKYFDVLEENLSVQYIQCKYIPVSFCSSDSTDSLWRKHDSAIEKTNVCDLQPKQSLMDLKIEIANRIFHSIASVKEDARLIGKKIQENVTQ